MTQDHPYTYTGTIELEDPLNKLRSWKNTLEFLGDYYSSNTPDLKRLIEEYTPNSTIFWAF